MGGGESSGGGWGRKDHPHGSLCNNDSNVNDGAATSINSGLLQELQRRPAGGFTLQSADLGHVGVSHPAIREGRDAQETNNNTHTHQAALLHLAVPFLLNFGDSAAFSADAGLPPPPRRRTCHALLEARFTACHAPSDLAQDSFGKNETRPKSTAVKFGAPAESCSHLR